MFRRQGALISLYLHEQWYTSDNEVNWPAIKETSLSDSLVNGFTTALEKTQMHSTKKDLAV